jgi:hypothetical protein
MAVHIALNSSLFKRKCIEPVLDVTVTPPKRHRGPSLSRLSRSITSSLKVRKHRSVTGGRSIVVSSPPHRGGYFDNLNKSVACVSRQRSLCQPLLNFSLQLDQTDLQTSGQHQISGQHQTSHGARPEPEGAPAAQRHRSARGQCTDARLNLSVCAALTRPRGLNQAMLHNLSLATDRAYHVSLA